MYKSVIAYWEKLDWNYWPLIYLCNVRNKPDNWFVSSTTFPGHLFIAVFYHILSTKPVWFLITVHTSQSACNQCNQNNSIIFFFTAIFYFLLLSHQYLVESLKTWFRRIAAFLVYIKTMERCANSWVVFLKCSHAIHNYVLSYALVWLHFQ